MQQCMVIHTARQVALVHVRITVSSHGANNQCLVSVPIRGVNALAHQHGAHAWHTLPLIGELGFWLRQEN
jgi:hypothetical protein